MNGLNKHNAYKGDEIDPAVPPYDFTIYMLLKVLIGRLLIF